MDIWSPAVASADTQQFCKRTTLEAYELQRVETTREALLQLVTQLESFPTHYAKILARPTVPEPKGVWSGISDVAWDTAASVLRRFTGRLTEETLQQKDVVSLFLPLKFSFDALFVLPRHPFVIERHSTPRAALTCSSI